MSSGGPGGLNQPTCDIQPRFGPPISVSNPADDANAGLFYDREANTATLIRFS